MTIEVRVDTRPVIRVLAALGPDGKKLLFKAAADALRARCKDWLLSASASRHTHRLAPGAQNTGFLEDAAATMTAEATSDGGEVAVHAPGFGRVFGPIDIRPVNSRALTIPISAFSYGRRAGELAANGWTLFRLGKKQGGENGVLFGKGPDQKITALYRLKSHVRLPQDRGLLPPDDAMAETCATAMKRVISGAMA